MAITKQQAFNGLKSQDDAPIYHRDLIGEQPTPHFFCQECGQDMVILWSKNEENRAIGIICPRCFQPEQYKTYFEQEDETQEGDFY